MQVFVAATLWFSLAAASEPLRVLVVSVAHDQAAKRAAQYLSYGMREAAKHDTRYALVPLPLLYGEESADARRLQQEADRLTSEGQTLADDLETEKAEQKFLQALAKLEENLAVLDSPKPAARIALLAAGSALLLNNDKAGRSLIARALLYDPSCAPDPRAYNASQMAVFKDVKARLAKVAKGSLSVASNPSHAEFYVDGDFIGLTPDKIDRLSGGPHLIRVVRDGFKSAAQVVEVHGTRADLPVTVNLIGYASADRIEPQLQSAMSDVNDKRSRVIGNLAKAANADAVFFSVVSVSGEQTRVESGLFRADGKRLGKGERTFSAASDTFREEADRLWQQVTSQASGQIGDSKDAAIDRGESMGGHSPAKPIVSWTLISIGAAGLAVGGVFGILALRQNNNFTFLVQNSGQATTSYNSIRTEARLADIMYGAGGVVVVAGVLCLLLWNDTGAGRDVVSLGPLKLDIGLGSLAVGGAF